MPNKKNDVQTKENETVKVGDTATSPTEPTTKEKASSEKNDPLREISLLKKQLEEKENELEKQKEELSVKEDKFLRMAAEYDNFRKRAQKEKESIYSDATSDTLVQFLPILDNLERAVDFELAKETADKAVLDGIGKILTQFTDTFKKMGVSEIPAKNEKFNPEFHNAVMHEESEELEENIITDVFMKGYLLGEKVIRHSVVKVVN
jgi:Molecular chaperone GrpE (heat shock protein)